MSAVITRAEARPKYRVSMVELLILAVGATTVNSALYFTGMAAGASFDVTGAPMDEITYTLVGVASFVPLLLMGTIALYLGWLKPSILPAVRWIGVIVALGSIASSYIATDSFAAGTWLGLMHVVSAIAWFVAVGRKSAH
ncbi:DUF6069 family protein [Glutamicibacter protophormiae]|uniref:DUF6069 family protein n=1 Tax=Glutamicibacter protophormiae TaxID=37930 RepID=UPI00195E6715|nr:DUF6069 family protein [Glutamicibacter protophormiae]QRQ79636.1 hypothetical protein JQN66_05295 [Glutamicibacter protophormiae]